jgi:hypothetical protein
MAGTSPAMTPERLDLSILLEYDQIRTLDVGE